MFLHAISLFSRSVRCVLVTLFVAVPLAIGDVGSPSPRASKSIVENLKTALSVSDLTVVEIDDAPESAGPSQVRVALEGQWVTLDLDSHSVRASDFEVLVEGPDGLASIDPGPVRTVRGSVGGIPGSIVTGSIISTGVDLRIQLPSGRVYGLTSARRHIPTAAAALHALYDMDTSIEAPGECGVHFAPDAGVAVGFDGTDAECEPVGPFVARLGCDTEAPFVSSFLGTPAQKLAAAQQWIEDNVNEINAVVYEGPALSTTHVIARIVLRDEANDIYADTTDGGIILTRMRTEWRTTQADSDADMVALWLARNLSGTTIGLGTVGNVCSPSSCWVEKRTVSQRLGLLAHEIGHGWGSWHCSGVSYPGDVCAVCTSPCPVMSSASLYCGPPEFSQCSLDEILARRPNFACVGDQGFVAPTVLDESAVLNDGDILMFPEVLTGAVAGKTLHIRNNQDCVLRINVRLTSASGQFALSNPPTLIEPLGAVAIPLTFSAAFAGDYSAELEIAVTGVTSGYEFTLHLQGKAGVDANLPATPELLCPPPGRATVQPEETIFRWAAGDFVESYQFQIHSSTAEVLYSQGNIRALSHSPVGLSLPVEQLYSWTVTAHNANGSTLARSEFFVDPVEVANQRIDVSFSNISQENNATLNLPLSPESTVFDFVIRNDTAIQQRISNVSAPDGFQAQFFPPQFSGLEGDEISVFLDPCQRITLRLSSTLDPGSLAGMAPITGTLEFDTNNPSLPHFTIHLCFRCDPLSCFGDPFSGCGVVTHVTQGGCWHFVADCGTEFGIRNLGDFAIGDTIWISGTVDPGADFCFPRVDLPQITTPQVGSCIDVTGELIAGPPCPGASCPLQIRVSPGVIYDVQFTDGYKSGDRVHVIGGLASYVAPYINSQGLIFGNTIDEVLGVANLHTGD